MAERSEKWAGVIQTIGPGILYAATSGALKRYIHMSGPSSCLKRISCISGSSRFRSAHGDGAPWQNGTGREVWVEPPDGTLCITDPSAADYGCGCCRGTSNMVVSIFLEPLRVKYRQLYGDAG